MNKRKWYYIQNPSSFSIPGCKCGNDKVKWSEYEKHLWCDKCQIDFIPKHNGIFDGPIPIETLTMFGINFDRYNLETNRVEIFDINTLMWEERCNQFYIE